MSPSSEGSSRLDQTPTDIHNVPDSTDPTDPPTYGFLHGKEKMLEDWDFTVTSCLCMAAPNSGLTTTQSLTEDETLKRTFHDTGNRCRQNGIRLTPVVSTDTLECGETPHATWSLALVWPVVPPPCGVVDGGLVEGPLEVTSVDNMGPSGPAAKQLLASRSGPRRAALS